MNWIDEFGFACLGIFLRHISGFAALASPAICANAFFLILARYIPVMKIKHG